MKRAHLLVLAVAIVLSMAAPGVIPAQEAPSGEVAPSAPPVSTTTLSGTLVVAGDGSLVIRTDDGVESTFTVDGSTIRPASLTPGDRVSVDYHRLAGGAYLASGVTVLEGSGSATAGAVAIEDTGRTGSGGELPRTASPLPLFAVMGVLAIGAALGVRAIFRHMRPSV